MKYFHKEKWVALAKFTKIYQKKESQTTDRQFFTLMKYADENNFTFDKILQERVSGNVKAENREEYKKLKYMLRKDDILVVTECQQPESFLMSDGI